jgi:ATP-dependent Clp protease ATP-binding subunit ClpA
VIPEAVFKYKELAHPVLFDRHGRLQLTAFETSGQATLSQAKSEAATAGIDLIDVFVLLLALLQSPGNELSRLLKLQGVTPESLQDRIQAVVVANSTASHRLQEVAILSQFDFWSSAIEVLNMAWEVAQYDQGQIGETHLVYGLLLSPGVSRLLAQAGLDVNQMVTQVAWH